MHAAKASYTLAIDRYLPGCDFYEACENNHPMTVYYTVMNMVFPRCFLRFVIKLSRDVLLLCAHICIMPLSKKYSGDIWVYQRLLVT